MHGPQARGVPTWVLPKGIRLEVYGLTVVEEGLCAEKAWDVGRVREDH